MRRAGSSALAPGVLAASVRDECARSVRRRYSACRRAGIDFDAVSPNGSWGRSGPSALNFFSVTPGRRRRRSGAAVTRTVPLVRKRHVSGPSQHRVGAVSTEDPNDACDSYCRKAGPP